MNHTFVASAGDANKCRCGRPEIDHTDRATCEVCSNSGTCELLYGSILMCMDCQEKEKNLQAQNNTPEKQQERVDNMNAVLAVARAIDTSVQVRTDLFNAETVAITDIKRAIDEDPSIENKHFSLSKVINERYIQFKDAVFAKKQEIAELESKIRANQTYYNELSKKLRAEERAQLKIKDVTYQPAEPKEIKAKVAKPSVNKVELERLCNEFKVDKSIVSVVLLQKQGWTIEQAVRHVKEKLG